MSNILINKNSSFKCRKRLLKSYVHPTFLIAQKQTLMKDIEYTTHTKDLVDNKEN